MKVDIEVVESVNEKYVVSRLACAKKKKPFPSFNNGIFFSGVLSF